MEYISLSDIASYKQGRQVPVEEQSFYCEKGMKRFVRIVDFTNPGEAPRYINDLGSQYEVDEKSIVMIRYGSQTAGSIVRGISGIIANNMFQICINDERFDIDFMYYYLATPTIKSMLMSSQSSSTMPAITFGMMRQIQVPIRSIGEQRKIAHVLSIIDAKIEKNKQINRNLLEQARTLYKSWFMDFEPYGREMPGDWHCGTVDEIIELHDSVRKPLSGNERDKLEKIYPYYGATSIMDYVDDYLFDGIYLLLGEDGSVIDAEGYPILQYVFGKFWANNHAHIITGKNGFSVEELYLLFSLTHIQDIVTGAVQLKISQQNLKKVEAIIPSMSELRKFDEIIQPMFGQIRNLRLENEKLNALRDSLLPKLLSGDLDVSDLDI